jgi:hypothetical protein
MMWNLQEGEDGEGGEVVIADEPIDVGAETAVSLETVVEEDDDEDQPLQDKQDRTIVHESVNSSENSKLRSSTVPVVRRPCVIYPFRNDLAFIAYTGVRT